MSARCGFRGGRDRVEASVARVRPPRGRGGRLADDSRRRRRDVGATLSLVESFCLFGGEAAPPLCRALAPLAAETARARDEALRRKSWAWPYTRTALEKERTRKKNDDEKKSGGSRRFSVEQATLLELVARAAAAAPRVIPLVKGRD